MSTEPTSTPSLTERSEPYNEVVGPTELTLYIVTEFGLNSTPKDMWVPKNRVFLDYAAAHAYFRSVYPWHESEDELVRGEHDGLEYAMHSCEADKKRPQGVVLRRVTVPTTGA